MWVVWRQEIEWMGGLRSGQRESDRCCQGRMRRYPDCSATSPGLSRRAEQRLRQRIGRSIVFHFISRDRRMPIRVLTKMRMPSASFCQRSTILLSSSSAALEYMEKRGPELSPKLDFPCNGWSDVVTGWSGRSSAIHIAEKLVTGQIDG